MRERVKKEEKLAKKLIKFRMFLSFWKPYCFYKHGEIRPCQYGKVMMSKFSILRKLQIHGVNVGGLLHQMFQVDLSINYQSLVFISRIYQLRIGVFYMVDYDV